MTGPVDLAAITSRPDLLRVAAAWFGAWFLLNAVFAAVVLGAGIDFFVAGNWEHGGLHLVTGALGLLAATAIPRARAYLLALAGAYLVIGLWGAIVGDRTLGVVEVDTFGTIVHLTEATLAGALVLLAPRAT